MYKPGNGWKHISGPVYEHESGVRIHTMGLIKFGVNSHADSSTPEIRRYIRINGGNTKRGLMAYAFDKINHPDWG